MCIRDSVTRRLREELAADFEAAERRAEQLAAAQAERRAAAREVRNEAAQAERLAAAAERYAARSWSRSGRRRC